MYNPGEGFRTVSDEVTKPCLGVSMVYPVKILLRENPF